MSHSIWKDLCKQPVITASSHKQTTIVTNATTQLRQRIDSILPILSDRAIALSECANFDAALRDANAMQQLSPSSTLGYLCAAKIYIEQGKWRQAIDVCNKGLNVVDTNDSHYAMLQRAKNVSEQCASKRIDFFKGLPVDIVIAKLVPLLVDDGYMDGLKPSPYLFVSHLWRDRIIESLGGLRIQIGSKEDDNLLPVIELAPHIKALHIRRYRKGTWLADLIGDNDFSSLQELHIEGFGSKHIGNFLASLKSISSTLTHLVMDMENGPMLGVPEIVLACPNLTMLRIIEPHDANVSLLLISTWPTLTTLSLTYTHTDITCEQIIAIWERFPSLKKLTLMPCTDIRSPFIVLDYRPTMKSLHLCMEGMGIQLIYSDEGCYSEEPGMTKLMISTDDMAEGSCKDTTSIIKQYHKTLEHLEWDMDTSEDTESIDDLHFPRLTKLGLFTCGWQILRNAPMLQELMFTSKTITTHPQVLDTIPQLLKSLDLKFIGALEYEHEASILRYLHRIAIQHQLRQLVIRFYNTDNEAILDAIFRHSHLEDLSVGVKKEWNYYRMQSFIHGLARSCPLLSSLELKCTNAPTTSSMNILKGLPNLNKLTFSINGTADIDSFWDAIESFPQLKCITINPSSIAQDARINHLKRQRPDIKVIIDKDAITV